MSADDTAELRMTCALCGEQMDFSEVIGHLRDMHEINEDFERWPDGEVVIHDGTLEPSDFGGVA